jgi:hypothetical protein
MIFGSLEEADDDSPERKLGVERQTQIQALKERHKIMLRLI